MSIYILNSTSISSNSGVTYLHGSNLLTIETVHDQCLYSTHFVLEVVLRAIYVQKGVMLQVFSNSSIFCSIIFLRVCNVFLLISLLSRCWNSVAILYIYLCSTIALIDHKDLPMVGEESCSRLESYV